MDAAHLICLIYSEIGSALKTKRIRNIKNKSRAFILNAAEQRNGSLIYDRITTGVMSPIISNDRIALSKNWV